MNCNIANCNQTALPHISTISTLCVNNMINFKILIIFLIVMHNFKTVASFVLILNSQSSSKKKDLSRRKRSPTAPIFHPEVQQKLEKAWEVAETKNGAQNLFDFMIEDALKP